MADRAITQSASADLAQFPPLGKLPRVAGYIAVAAALAFATLLGVRTINSPDVGYHLDYGLQFWRHGTIVDHDERIYTLPSADTPADKRPDPGPGSWYDQAGRYRFPNANWLTQVVMAGFYLAGGLTGLLVLQSLLAGGLFLLLAMILRRLGVGPLYMAASLILLALVAYERFLLRPEIFGYVALAAMLWVLVGWRGRGRQVAALGVLMLLLVNLHSYFLLGLAMTVAFLAEALARVAWSRLSAKWQAGTPATDNTGNARSARRLGLVLGIQAIAMFVNPWTWRLVLLPFQTLWFLRQRDIRTGDGVGSNPMRVIGELDWALDPTYWPSHASKALAVLLAISAIALVVALVRRRFAIAMVIALGVASSLSLRRNIALAAVLSGPLAMAELWAMLRWTVSRPTILARLRRFQRPAAIAFAAVLLLTQISLIASVVNQRFYTSALSPVRFGGGLSWMDLPVGPCNWLNEHKPRGRLWTDFNSGSNVCFFSGYRVPVLTNTFAYPPETMRLSIRAGQIPEIFDQLRDSYDVQIVLLQVDPINAALAWKLAHNRQWAMTYVDAHYALFVKSDGPNAALARKTGLTPATLDLPAHIRTLRSMDVQEDLALWMGATTLWTVGWDAQAIAILEDLVKRSPQNIAGWYQLGRFRGLRATRELARGHVAQATDDLREAIKCFENVLNIDPTDEQSRINIKAANMQLDDAAHMEIPTSQPIRQ